MQKSEASQYIGLGVRTIESLLPEIPHFRVGGRVLFRRSELDQWMQRHREHAWEVDVEKLADDAVAAVMR
jgi:excisionase family DNA binding protein